jgi:hypothetical protein
MDSPASGFKTPRLVHDSSALNRPLPTKEKEMDRGTSLV